MRALKSGFASTWTGVAVLALLLPASAWLVRRADGAKPVDWQQDRLAYVPSGKLLKPMAMDLDEAFADVLWIRGMLYFSDAYLEGRSYDWLGQILDIVTALNPHFRQAYEFAGVVLTKNKTQLPKNLKVLERGIAVFPHDWKLRVFAAMAQVQLDSNQVKAAEYLAPIALETNVPDHIRTLSATYLSQGGGRRLALAFLVNSYIRSGNAINREVFLEKVLKLYPSSDVMQETGRKKTAETILQQAIAHPQVELLALGLLHEYLSDSLSQQSAQFLEKLRR